MDGPEFLYGTVIRYTCCPPSRLLGIVSR